MDFINTAINVLSKYPLCDHCLGRLFALSGYGLENWERGRSIKDVIHMDLVRRVKLGESSAVDLLAMLAASGHGPSARFLMDRMNRRIDRVECPVCRDVFRLVDEAAKITASTMSSINIEFSTFQVGTMLPRELLDADLRLSMEAAAPSSESIKRELNRLIGKRVQAITGKEFSRSPDIVAVVSLPSLSVSIIVMPIYAAGTYRKLMRSPPPLADLASRLNAGSVVIHSPLKDSEARVLSDERVILQLSNPRSRQLPAPGLLGFLELRGFLRVSRRDVEQLKEDIDKERTYRGLVIFNEPPPPGSLSALSTLLEGKRVRQGRRTKQVRFLRLIPIGERVAEIVLRSEGGISVEGLVDGVGVSPSISGLLGIQAKLVQLDVLDST